MRWIYIAMLVAILASLFSALFTLMKRDQPATKMVKTLTLRVGLSITLFLILILLKSGVLLS